MPFRTLVTYIIFAAALGLLAYWEQVTNGIDVFWWMLGANLLGYVEHSVIKIMHENDEIDRRYGRD